MHRLSLVKLTSPNLVKILLILTSGKITEHTNKLANNLIKQRLQALLMQDCSSQTQHMVLVRILLLTNVRAKVTKADKAKITGNRVKAG